MDTRSLSEIAKEISRDWLNVYFGAVPYLNAMYRLNSINDKCGVDSGKSIVLYFLCNARSWKGDKAREIK